MASEERRVFYGLGQDGELGLLVQTLERDAETQRRRVVMEDDADPRRLRGRRQAARAERPWDYAAHPAIPVNRRNKDFVDGEGRSYRILRSEMRGDDTLPLYCRSNKRTLTHLQQTSPPGSRLQLSFAGRLAEAANRDMLTVEVLEFGRQARPSRVFTGRVVVRPVDGTLTPAMIAESDPEAGASVLYE